MTGARIGVYPGTFDPVTSGHLDVIHRASLVVDRLIVAVAENAGKGPLFRPSERVEMIVEALAARPDNGSRIEVRPFANLLTEFAASVGAQVIIRGLRAVSDFEYEFQMAAMNARLHPEIDTLFLMAGENQHFVSSRFVKEIGRMGGDISSFVTREVRERMLVRFAEHS